MFDTIIIGAGVVGLATAMYAGRLNLKTLVLGASATSELPIGGVITLTDTVENYPGFIHLTGMELAQKIEEHARQYNVEIKEEKVLEAKKNNGHFMIKTEESEYRTKTIIFATGAKWRELTMKGAAEFKNKGVHYCALCLHPDEEIVANSSLKKIKEITPSTRALTHDGTYKHIEGFTKSNYEGPLSKITTRFFTEPVLLTPNHPVLRSTLKKGAGTKYWDVFEIGNPSWVKAGALKKGDCVIYPIPKETTPLKKIKISDYIEVKKLPKGKILPYIVTHTSTELNDAIPITDKFLRLVGYYIAEGSAHKELRLYFNKDETEYITDVASLLKEIFNSEPAIRYFGSICAISISSKPLCDLFKQLFGNYAFNKHLPHWMMALPVDQQSQLIKGMWRGNGCLRKKDFTYVTSSRTLAYQLRDLLLRQHIIPSVQRRDKRGLKRMQNKIEGRVVGFNHDKYHLTVGGEFLKKMSAILEIEHPFVKRRSGISRHAWIKENNAVLPIRKIEKIQYAGQVLNIGVSENNTYVAKNFVVHNCDGALFQNKTVAIIGGSDTAAKEALLLAQYAQKVYIIYRGDKIRPEPVNGKLVDANKKITVITNTNIMEIQGEKFVNKIILDKEYGGKKELDVEGVFGAIGHIPLSDVAAQLGVKINEKKEIMINRDSKTNIPGVFAAGDVVDSGFKQAITGVGEGVVASHSAFTYVKENEVIDTK